MIERIQLKIPFLSDVISSTTTIRLTSVLKFMLFDFVFFECLKRVLKALLRVSSYSLHVYFQTKTSGSFLTKF